MIVAGVGFRRTAPAEEIVALVERAAGAGGPLTRLATLEALASAPAFGEAAARLGLDAVVVGEAAARAAPVRTVSERAMRAHGVGSVAEAAALAAAGPGAVLVLPRIASASVTCALARPAGEERS